MKIIEKFSGQKSRSKTAFRVADKMGQIFPKFGENSFSRGGGGLHMQIFSERVTFKFRMETRVEKD